MGGLTWEGDASSADERKNLLVLPVEDDAPDGPLFSSSSSSSAAAPPPEDLFGIGYAVFFTLGAGFLLPWNAFITAVDYFSYLYPGVPVDRVFSVSYMLSCLVPLLFIVGWAHKSSAPLRINSGLALFTLALFIVPIMDALYVKGVRGLYPAYDVTVAATALCGVADALVQGGVIGSAGELPERYMQAVVAGTAFSAAVQLDLSQQQDMSSLMCYMRFGVLVSIMRVFTKAIYPQDAHGLRKSAILYFVVSIVVMAICLVCYNIADHLPVVQHYKNIKLRVLKEESNEKSSMTGSAWRSTLWSIVGRIKWHGFGIFLIYVVTLSIFPGYITEDVHSEALKDWYPIILIAGYNIFDLVGKSLPALYLLENADIAVAGCVVRLLFYPLFLGCLHGPKFFRTEIPVTVLTCLLGLTNGYLTSVLMILAPKTVPIQHSETAAIVIVLFLVIGLSVGSVVSWFWVI
ncbi:Equilibrative nucleotide transporter 1 [Ananas comosus]|uniref:Equilibrative nucleotide transporter 1 n=1 Tax=Ananas comosus TaxID=4615 RepID=A0A199VUR8_ANACO|nr:Equilibrative nucleotide transporter 1 [Ananas comosus]